MLHKYERAPPFVSSLRPLSARWNRLQAFGKRAKSLSLLTAVWGRLIGEGGGRRSDPSPSTETPPAPGVNPKLADGDKSDEEPQSGCG